MQHRQAKCRELQASQEPRGRVASAGFLEQDACGAGEAGQVASSEKFSQVVGQRLRPFTDEKTENVKKPTKS